MDNFNFEIENDVLMRNEILNTDEANVFTVRKVPVISKEAFLKLLEEWGTKEVVEKLFGDKLKEVK